MPTHLEQLKQHSIIVADTADFGLLEEYKPQDATTNPSLVLAGTQLEKYAKFVDDALQYAKKQSDNVDDQVELCIEKLTVNFGLEILKIVPGRVSTEVDAKYSFDVDGSVKQARRLVQQYADNGIGKDRLYIKLSSTWQGIQAARILEAEGVSCNMTLLFSFAQAVACAQAGVALISPFVGRIFDWHKKAENKESYAPEEDPGVKSVTRIYNYFKAHGYKTVVMGASFRNVGEITELCGCDKITISPKLLAELAKATGDVPKKLDASKAKENAEPKLPELSESDFLFMHNEDPMAVEKLAEGIRGFNKDTRTLEKILREKLQK
jgi:transaldolase